jgi:AcrR family transcriptional regulator
MNEINTQNRIVSAALVCFLSRGIKKTSMDEIAAQAGVTRITAYRYFENKKILVRAAFLQIVTLLESIQTEIEQASEDSIERYLDKIEAGFSALPKGDLPTRLEELSRLYPEIYTEFHAARKAAITQIFDQLFAEAQNQGLLREGLNQEIVQVYFTEAVIQILENPQLIALNLSTVEVFSTVKSIFLYGILKETP